MSGLPHPLYLNTMKGFFKLGQFFALRFWTLFRVAFRRQAVAFDHSGVLHPQAVIQRRQCAN